MNEARSSSDPDPDSKSARISEIADNVVRQREAGAEVDDAALEQRYPELMPELSQRLRALRAIRSAARRAREETAPEHPCAPEQPAAAEDLRFLQESLRDYDILERVSYGGQGVVYKAVQLAANRTVAIKVLLEGPLATERQRHRFAREVELISRLQHPHIVTLYESGFVRGWHYFAMEYVDGLPIDDYVLLHRLSVHEIVRLAVAVCRAVNYAHLNGIIHRDLNPANVLIDVDGEPHILDFGLAKEISSDWGAPARSRLSMPGQVVGTLPYLSPEQAGGLVGRVDVRSDVYALGIVLFQLVAGRFPYPVDEDAPSVRANIISREPMRLRKALAPQEAPRRFDRSTHEDLEAVLLKAMAKEPEHRYQSAAALAEDLERYLAGEAVVARADNRSYLLRKTIRKYRVPAAISAAFLVLLLAGFIGMTALWRRAERVAETAQAGLAMGGMLRVGSTYQDQGRADQAAAMFNKAIEIAGSVPSDDPTITRFLYDAHHALAELYYETGAVAQGDRHSNAAVTLAEGMVRLDPRNPEYRRLSAFSHVLRGRSAAVRGEWARALEDFDQAASLRAALVAAAPRDSSLKLELVKVLGWQGECCRRLGRFDEALAHFTRARELCEALATSEPDVADYQIELSRTETWLAAWYMSQRTPEHDQAALEWLRRAETRLTELHAAGRLLGREEDLQRLKEAIRANRQKLAKRAASAPR